MFDTYEYAELVLVKRYIPAKKKIEIIKTHLICSCAYIKKFNIT